MFLEVQMMYSMTLAVAMLMAMAGSLTCRRSAAFAWFVMTMVTGSAFVLSMVLLVGAVRS
jgi:hypothetical protein